MSSAGNNFYLQFFQSMLFPAGWTAPPQHIGEGTPAERLHLGCYSAHILQFVEFRQGCYPQHNSQKRTLLRRSCVVIQGTIPKIFFHELLFAAHFTKSRIFLPLLLRSAQFFLYAGHGCYRQHNSGLQDFCFRGC